MLFTVSHVRICKVVLLQLKEVQKEMGLLGRLTQCSDALLCPAPNLFSGAVTPRERRQPHFRPSKNSKDEGETYTGQVRVFAPALAHRHIQ